MPLASHLAMSIGFFAGILPAVIIVFMTLKEYDDYYEDKHFFLLLVIGLFAGTMTSLIYYWSIFYLSTNLTLLSLVAIIIGFALYEMLLFTIILSMKRFGAKYDLTYYGVVLGGSIAGVICMFSIFVFLFNFDLTNQAILSMALLIPTMPLTYISLSALMGYGISHNKYLKYGIWVVILKSIFNVVFIFWFIAFLYWEERGWDLMIFGFVFGVLLYWYIIRQHLPNSLPEALRKNMRRKKRRQRLKI